jgi:hypothetical protein
VIVLGHVANDVSYWIYLRRLLAMVPLSLHCLVIFIIAIAVALVAADRDLYKILDRTWSQASVLG